MTKNRRPREFVDFSITCVVSSFICLSDSFFKKISDMIIPIIYKFSSSLTTFNSPSFMSSKRAKNKTIHSARHLSSEKMRGKESLDCSATAVLNQPSLGPTCQASWCTIFEDPCGSEESSPARAALNLRSAPLPNLLPAPVFFRREEEVLEKRVFALPLGPTIVCSFS